ncbi:MAG: ATP-binding cassette domain-containing protein [Bacteroidales bacterium]|jgi:cell division transport system ATP-binding protein|nr:ATP-binding cassette domain-containing protein [Bacteroidales bacterium]
MALDTIIEFENASIFQKDNLILKDVNLSIEKGEFVYLIGKVGSGKTSLIKTINAEIPIKENGAKVAGFDLTKLKTKQVPLLRRKLGIVFQDFKLLTDRTVFDNLQFVLKATGWKNKSEINDRIAQVLDRVGLGYKGYKMPHQLSGGEQQRVVIARALLNDPEIILADEPTGNLDPETSENLMELFLEISNNGRTVVMATHDYNIVKKFPARTVQFDNGKVIEEDQNKEIDFESLKE